MKILFVTSRFPYPHQKGDQLRAYHAIRELGRHHEIGLVSASDRPVAAASITEMGRFCATVEVVPVSRAAAIRRVAMRVASSLPLQVLYFDAPQMRRAVARALATGDYDVVHAQLLRVLPHLQDSGAPPVVVDLMDAFGLSLAGRRDRAQPFLRPLYELERRRTATYERRAVGQFAELVVAAEGDRIAVGGGENVAVVTNGVDLDAFRFGPLDGRAERTAIVTGNMGYGPNVDAARWLACEIWPRVRACLPDARLRLVGAAPARNVRALAGDGIDVTGAVDDINAELRSATLAVCPIRTGTGVQNKVLEALASGTPLISTALGNRGVGATPGRDFVLADDAEAIADAILTLFADRARRASLAAAGRALMESAYDWAVHARALEAIYARAVSASGSDGGGSGAPRM